MSIDKNNEIPNILVVDDTPANLRLLANILSEQGYRVRPVPNGKLALSAATAEAPNLILLDIRMPELNGYQVCEILKNDPKLRDVPVIFISAMDATQDKVRAFRAGGVDYITKPFQVEEVLARVETHLRMQRLQNDLRSSNRVMRRELKLAGEIQASFLPRRLPEIEGWEFSARLIPARQTSGDFYDMEQMPSGTVYMICADVVDKGAGAAMFMSLCVSLIRTYTGEYPRQPEQVLASVNRRLLEDTGGEQFVSVLLGMLDPTSGELQYCNAGHPPAILLRAAAGEVQKLGKTGIALGIAADQTWETGVVNLDPGDLLLMYSDGITDAMNEEGGFFGDSPIKDMLKGSAGKSALDVQEALLAEVREFAGSAAQHDDIALVTVRRGRREEIR